MLVQGGGRRAQRGARQRAAAVQHFLANRHADAFLELEAHQRHGTIEGVGGLVHVSSAEQRHDFDEQLWKREPRHGAGGAGEEFLEEEHAAQPAEDADRDVAGRLDDARRLEGRRRILQLDRARARNLPGDSRQQRRLHGESGNGRVVLDDYFDIDRICQRLVMTNDRLRVELGHPRRAHHDGRGARGQRVPAMRDTGPCPFRCRAGHDANAAPHLLHRHLEHPATLGIVQARDLARDPKRGDPVHTGVNEQIDDPPEAGFIDVAARQERRREDGIHALKLHGNSRPSLSELPFDSKRPSRHERVREHPSRRDC